MINRIINKINSIFFTFKPNIFLKKKLEHIGTNYGGYDVYTENLFNPNIISCGLGEDASFDIEMINKFDAKVYSIDPTPRSLNHYNDIKLNFGKKNKTIFNESGKLSVFNYNLEKTNKQNFIFINKAIWKENNKNIKLFFPKNQKHVSLSINKNEKFSNNYYSASTIDYKEIIKSFNINKVDILKLDIEGAEIEVLNSVLKNFEIPNQILVEFDIRRRPNFKSYLKLKNIHKKISFNYDLVNINPKGDFTYIKKI